MAMTGSGSAEDPLKPTNWNEFVDAITRGGTYVECPEDTVWDMNEIKPDGVDQIYIRCTRIIGNGLIIKNLYCRANQLFYTRFHESYNYTMQHSVSIYDIHFINMNIYNRFLRIGESNDSWDTNTRYFIFYGCTFTGISSDTNIGEFGIFSIATYSSSSYLSVLQFRVSPNTKLGCTFKIVGMNTNLFGTKDGRIEHYFSYINFEGNILQAADSAVASHSVSWPWYENCLIEGTCYGTLASDNNSVSVLGIRAKNSVFNMTVKNSGYRGFDDSKNLSNVVINTDKIPDTFIYPGFITVTSDQLQDAEYLRSKGFPIGIRNGS